MSDDSDYGLVPISPFWDKVGKCGHEHLTGYYDWSPCENEGCVWEETHCADCGVFIVECACGVNNRLSGWTNRRFWKWFYKKQEKYSERVRTSMLPQLPK
jgi:hypothetical protein